MLVCHCEVVSDRDIREAISCGARDEFDVAQACGAGSRCGGCVPAITALLAEGTCAPGCPIPGALQATSDRAPGDDRRVAGRTRPRVDATSPAL